MATSTSLAALAEQSSASSSTPTSCGWQPAAAPRSPRAASSGLASLPFSRLGVAGRAVRSVEAQPTAPAQRGRSGATARLGK
ncbi:hypothetical protein ACFPRL_18690 [Pseudoclavibacter helvolus]